MRKTVVMLLLVGIAVCGMRPSELLAKDEKIAFVDPMKIVREYQRTKDFEQILEKEVKKGQAELDSRTESIKSLKDNLEILSEEAKKGKEEEIYKKIQELRNVEKETKDNLLRMRDENMRDILKEINEIVDEHGKSKGYSLVLDGRMILFSDANLDISDEILKILNERYKKGQGK